MNYTNANSIQLFFFLIVLFVIIVFAEGFTKQLLKFYDWIDNKIDPLLDKLENWIEGNRK